MDVDVLAGHTLMNEKRSELNAARARWQDAREVAELLRDSWAALVRTRAQFLKAALQNGIKTDDAIRMYDEVVHTTQQEYADAFTDACRIRDEYTALALTEIRNRSPN